MSPITGGGMWNVTAQASPEGRPLLDSWHIEHVGLREARLRAESCARARMTPEGAADFAVAVNEIVTNAKEHGGGRGRVRVWRQHDELVCEVADEGAGVSDPAAGSGPPPVSTHGGYGLWMARQLCRRVHGRTAAGAGTTVWLHGGCNPGKPAPPLLLAAYCRSA
jgi:serine/threonine-protein kinase RsbW